MDKNGKYAIFGTPCQIFGLDKYLKCRKRREQFVLIDIYCHGCPSMNVWSKYVKKIQQQSGFKK
ncbi:Coenzyme F420 hydrogenase/dehydrogenase, beta subunit C-terminal domain, partial [Acinetobacter baumannii]|nr:Coenzyme F420 hydrogenase/dehydrogenase, beta subunit C-terminal domain [Acinetobacter baumannii]